MNKEQRRVYWKELSPGLATLVIETSSGRDLALHKGVSDIEARGYVVPSQPEKHGKDESIPS